MFDLIAEIGVAHGGSLDVAKRLADAALNAGFAAVKGQLFRPETLTHDARDRAILAPLALSVDDHAKLFEHCAGLGIEYLATPFDLQAVDELEAIGVKRYKVASTDITWRPLLERIGATHKPVLLSTGAADVGEIYRAVDVLRESPVTLLHCVSSYPAEPTRACFQRITWLMVTFGSPVGYSDHVGGVVPVMAAAMLGATTIEVHVCPDGYAGPDHEVSYPVSELVDVAGAVRIGLASRFTPGRNLFDSDPCESLARQYLRRGTDGLRPERP